MSRRLRLLHLDLKTVYSYGDQLLFEAVRHVFNGFAGGEYFDLSTSMPFRQRFTTKLVDEINAEFDGIVIGGGGLFPWKTNAAAASGWQWNISQDLLQRLEVPIVVFGVGNAPVMQPDRVNPVFSAHVRQLAEQAVFFGARSSGAVDSIRSHLPVSSHDRVTFQPCPTTLSHHLFPDLLESSSDERRIGLQVGLEQAHINDGLTPEVMYPRLVRLVGELRADGWDVSFIGHKRSDMGFHNAHGAELELPAVRLFGSPEILFEGVRQYSRFPVVLGARGHSQMIPFGVGGIPLSLATNDKIRYFAREVGHPEWLIDPWLDDMVDASMEAVSAAWNERQTVRPELDAIRERFLAITSEGLSSIYERIAGTPAHGEIVSYGRRERSLALDAYREGYRHREANQKLDRMRNDHRLLQNFRKRLDPDRLVIEARSLARRGDVASARRLIATAQTVGLETRQDELPRWAVGPGSMVPPGIANAVVRARGALRARRRG